MTTNGWRIMWVVAMFDLPTKTKAEIKAYSAYRKRLLRAGYTQLQFSVYIRHFPTFNKAKASVAMLGKLTPKCGQTSFFYITDKQYSMTESFYGSIKDNEKTPNAPEQLLLFE